MTLVLNGLNTILLGIGVAALISMFDHMTKETRNSVRVATLLLFVGAIAEGFSIWWRWGQWVDTLFFGSCSMLLVANIRKPLSIVCKGDPERVERIASKAAYAIGAVTVISVLFFWNRA